MNNPIIDLLKLKTPFILYALVFTIAINFLLSSCQEATHFPDPLEAGWKGKKVCELLSENEDIRVLKCTFPPQVGHEKHVHQAHFGYTLKGSRFRITDAEGSREVNVPSGYNFYNKGITIHEVQNIGDSTAIFLIVEPK